MNDAGSVQSRSRIELEVDCDNIAPILSEEVSFNRLRTGESYPPYYSELFSSFKWPFPSGILKDGHLSGTFTDRISDLLAQRASIEVQHRSTYLQYIEVWRTLHQTVLYLNLLALTLHQLQNSLQTQWGNIVDNLDMGHSLFGVLKSVSLILENLLRDTMVRVDTISMISQGGLQAGQAVFTNQLPSIDHNSMLSASTLKFVSATPAVKSILSSDSSLSIVNSTMRQPSFQRVNKHHKASSWTPSNRQQPKGGEFNSKRPRKDQPQSAPPPALKKDG